MAFAIDTYTGNGSTAGYSVTFPYIDKAHVVVTVDGVTKALTTDYTFTNSSTITFNSAPASGTTIKFTRKTSRTTRLVDYQDGSTLTEATLDQDGNQSFYMAQEAIDVTEGTMNISTSTDQWDATSKRITNVADPVNNNDAVNKSFITTNLPNINTVAGISSDVTTTAGISSNVTTVANNDSNITTLAGKATEIGRLGTADAVADMNTLGTSAIVTDMDTLADISSDITSVAGISSDVTSVANISANVTSVAGDATDIGAVASDIANVNTVAGSIANVNVVAGNNTNINTVATANSNITTIAGISSNITTVAGANSNISTVASDIANINQVAGSISNINTLATNILSVNDFHARYRVGATDPTTSLDEGDLFFNTTTNRIRFYNGTSWSDIDTGIQTETDPISPAFSIALG